MNETLIYYDENALNFFESTAHVDFSKQCDRFLKYLPSQATILDYGCGSGRDAKYFSELGFKVSALDGSLELCRLARRFTGLDVFHCDFLDLEAVSCFDGVWACSSLLHLNKESLKEALNKIHRALTEEGILYLSFKYGDFSGMRNGRYFQDFTVDSWRKFMDRVVGFDILELWVSTDVRETRGGERWLNVILRRKG